jgi:Transposase and inactivated derivatives
VQSGFEFEFEFDKRNGQTVLSLSVSKLVDIPITIHREVPDGVTVKEVSIKKERTGEWYASFAVEGKGEPAKLENPDRCVGIDVGILKYTHDTDGRAVGSLDLDLDLQNERERLTREQRSLSLSLSRKQQGSNNWETQRLRVVWPSVTSNSSASDSDSDMTSCTSSQTTTPLSTTWWLSRI